MALFAGNVAADLNIATLSAPANVNASGYSAALDVSNYLGVIGVILSGGNGATNTALAASLYTGNDTNSSNSIAVTNATFTNLTNVGAGFQTLGVDTRGLRKYLYLNYVISGTGANVTAGAIVVGQAKYKGGTGA